MANVVFDIGKTHAKLFLLNEAAQIIAQREMVNTLLQGGPYPHHDIANLWQFLLASLIEFAQHEQLEKICITTHGATAAVVNTRQEKNYGLMLPVLDYEYREVESINAQYAQHRPDFSQTFSPNLPAGLNLGKQLYWLSEKFPEEFKHANAILLYPQYWVWLLCGEAVTEITSVGCHSDLWSVKEASWSSLVLEQGWQHLFPPLKPAWEALGGLKPKLQQLTGLQKCQVYVGVHDSNASFLRYKRQAAKQDFTVFSTGTWCIAMANGVATKQLQANKDMLANVDVFAEAVACSRFMGGREFAVISEHYCAKSQTFNEQDMQFILDHSIFALPDFSGGSGPLNQHQGHFIYADKMESLESKEESNESKERQINGAALATIYCALMMDYQLELLKSTGEIYIEGAFTQNTLLCALLAQLRKDRKIKISSDIAGTVLGCAQLMDWKNHFVLELKDVQAGKFKNLISYKHSWRDLLKPTEN